MNPALKRETFTTSREHEYFSEDELAWDDAVQAKLARTQEERKK